MRVLATGPESSGTNALTRLLEAGGAETVHRSQPEGPDWIDLEAMLDDFDAVVVIIRGRLGHLSSCLRRGIEPDYPTADARRRKALARLAPILGHPKVHVVTYESLSEFPERTALLDDLGLDPQGAFVEAWTNENRKYLEITCEEA